MPACFAASHDAGDQIEAGDRMAGLDEIGGHRAAHVAEPDECDLAHVCPASDCLVWNRQFVGAATARNSGATISGVTSSMRAGDHFGLRSLSITAARTPSRNSVAAEHFKRRAVFARQAFFQRRRGARLAQQPQRHLQAGRRFRLAASSASLARSPTRRRPSAAMIVSTSIDARTAGRSRRDAAPRRRMAGVGRSCDRASRTSASSAPAVAVKAPRAVAGHSRRHEARRRSRHAIASAPFMVWPVSAKIRPDLARRARQQPRAADIREEADADFGHRQPGLLGDDAMAAMRGKADAAAHHDAVHVGDVRLAERRDRAR